MQFGFIGKMKLEKINEPNSVCRNPSAFQVQTSNRLLVDLLIKKSNNWFGMNVIRWLKCVHSYTWAVDRPHGEHQGLLPASSKVPSYGRSRQNPQHGLWNWGGLERTLCLHSVQQVFAYSNFIFNFFFFLPNIPELNIQHKFTKLRGFSV